MQRFHRDSTTFLFQFLFCFQFFFTKPHDLGLRAGNRDGEAFSMGIEPILRHRQC